MRKMLRNKKGMTMVEVVIAMVVVLLVTVAAMSIILSSTHTTHTAVCRSQAQYFVSDAFTSFRASDSAEEFAAAMEFCGGYSECAVNENQYIFVLEDSGYVAVANVIYPADGRATFSIEVTDGNADVVASVPAFTKGG